MKQHKNALRAISLLLTVTVMAAAFAACGKKPEAPAEEPTTVETQTVPMTYYTDTPGSVKKSETVYVNLDETGQTKSTIVSDWLHTDKACVKVADKSDLKNIVNIRSAVDSIAEKDALIWHMDSTDLYYRGTGTKALPITISTNAAIRVVILPSMMADNALAKPDLIAESTVIPARSSSLIRANMITFASTAIPTDRMIPAIPGSVMVISNRLMHRITIIQYITSAMELAKPGRR